MSDYLATLNKEQLEAVQQTDGPMLIMAGAGSGKTKVLTCKIAYLLDKGVAPYRILAITFTNKAAKEMRQRVDKLVGEAAKEVWLHTFHAFCSRVLRMDIDKLGGYSRSFSIYDPTDCKSVIKAALKKLSLDEKYYPVNNVLNTISNAKNAMLNAHDYIQAAQGFHEEKLGEIYAEYEQVLRGNNALDFDDLLLQTIKLFQYDGTVLARYQEKFQYVLIDEYQDTNHVQYMLARLLCAKHHNLCVVGDIDQSIYGWRGADINNILDFEKDYPTAKQIKLEQNYRSTQVILDAANAVIENNIERKPKKLWTDNPNGKPIVYYHASDDRDEAYFTVGAIRQWQDEGGHLGDIAILYRTNAQSRLFEEYLNKVAIPYVMVGGLKFYDRKEVKDTLAYLRLLFNPQDDQSLIRIINVPKRGIGAVTVEKIQQAAAQQQRTMLDVVLDTEGAKEFLGKTSAKLVKLAQVLKSLLQLKEQLVVKDLIKEVLNQTGYMEELEAEQNPQAEGRKENLFEFMRIADEFAEDGEEKNLENFLAHVALVADIDDAKFSDEAVTLMTLHSSKGLEFPVIFLAGMEDGMFPGARALDNAEEMEEERRLCYVGITRAQKKLYLLAAQSRMVYGRTVMYPPSRFLKEIPRPLLTVFQRPPKEHQAAYVTEKSKQLLHRPGGILGSGLTQSRNSYVPPENKQTGLLASGDKVRHAKWGVGTIISAKTVQDGQEVKVAFPSQGVRNLLTKYAVLTKI